MWRAYDQMPISRIPNGTRIKGHDKNFHRLLVFSPSWPSDVLIVPQIQVSKQECSAHQNIALTPAIRKLA